MKHLSLQSETITWNTPRRLLNFIITIWSVYQYRVSCCIEFQNAVKGRLKSCNF